VEEEMIISAMVALLLAQSPPQADDYCTCVSQSVSLKGDRDGGPQFSIVMPRLETKRSHRRGDEDDTFQWRTAQGYIASSYHGAGINDKPEQDAPGESHCTTTVNGRQMILKTPRRETGVRAYIQDPNHPKQTLVLGFSAKDRGGVCALAAMGLQSLAFVGDADKLVIESIAKDHTSFTYRNELGEIRTAGLHDDITRDFGRVTKITDSSVTVVELFEKNGGGWRSQEKTLRLKRNSEGKKK
jgi:hypothetical protein